MKPFSLPSEYFDAKWKIKHQYVKGFVNVYTNTLKTSINYKHGTKLWTTEYVLEVLSLLNLEPTDSDFTYIKQNERFNVNCKNHPDAPFFPTSLMQLLKGQICKYCLNTQKELSQEEAEERARSVGYILHSKYTGYHDVHMFTCPEGHHTPASYDTIFRGVCRVCGPEKKRKKLRMKFEHLSELFRFYNNLYKDVEVKLLTNEAEYDSFQGKSSEFLVRHTCSFCGDEKTSKMREVLQRNLMHQKCVGKFVNSLRMLTFEEVWNRFTEKNLKVLLSEEQFQTVYKNKETQIDYCCMTCGFEGIKRVGDILLSDCPMCHPNFYISNYENGKLHTWSRKVRASEDNTCFNCGLDYLIEAHHIYDKKTYPHLKLHINNGKALCFLCHRTGRKSYHKYLTARKLTSSNPSLFQEWLDEWGDLCKLDSHRYFLGYYDQTILPPKISKPFQDSDVFELIV